MLERLRRLLSPRPLETTYDDAATAFEQYHAETLEDAREAAERIRTDVATAVVDLEAGLSALEGFTDERDRVEDVVTHVATKRRSALEQLSLPDDPTALRDAVETFLQDRSDLSRKEAAILQQVELPPAYREAVEAFKESVERLDEFLATEQEFLAARERLAELVAQRRDQLERIETLDAELADLDPTAIEEDLASARGDLTALRESDRWAEYESLQARRETLEEERSALLNDLATAAADCRRGLRKLVYAVEHEGLDLEVDMAVLEALRDGRIEALLDRDPEAVEAAVETVATTVSDEHLADAERRRLLEGLEPFRDVAARAERLDTLDAEIETLAERLRSHEAPQRQSELEAAIERLQSDRAALETERDRLEGRLSDARDALAETESRIESVLEEHVPGNVRIEDERE